MAPINVKNAIANDATITYYSDQAYKLSQGTLVTITGITSSGGNNTSTWFDRRNVKITSATKTSFTVNYGNGPSIPITAVSVALDGAAVKAHQTTDGGNTGHAAGHVAVADAAAAVQAAAQRRWVTETLTQVKAQGRAPWVALVKAERQREGGGFKFRRGFHLEPGQKVVMVEDIVTTGLSSSAIPEFVTATILSVLGRHYAGVRLTREELAKAAVAEEVGDVVYFINDGKVAECGPPAQVIRNSQNPRTQEFLSRIR